ncbi:hypothetical protein KKH3_18060 [Pectobacterium actinidiae]|nr:hypothetical protein KKH3_18060 [Pectobacterium actinidiae]
MAFFMTDILARHPVGRCFATLKNASAFFYGRHFICRQ